MASELWPVPVPSTNTRALGIYCHALLYMSARYLVLVPAQQALYPLSHLPRRKVGKGHSKWASKVLIHKG